MSDDIRRAYEIKGIVDRELASHEGFESHIFKIGSYNQSVSDAFQLPYDSSTMALLILSTPDMFDVAFRKWVIEKTMEYGSFDELAELVTSPIQTFLEDRLEILSERLYQDGETFEILHDYSMSAQRRPRILMQTCGHVAGAAYYYQPRHYTEEGIEWPPSGRMAAHLKFIGLSLHPLYGGHFAFRSVLIFPNVQIPNYVEKPPVSILKSNEQVRNALEKFNFNWKDSGFRDFGEPKFRYSNTQMEFFGTPVADRWEVLRSWVETIRD